MKIKAIIWACGIIATVAGLFLGLRGAAKAIVATAHKLAKIIYRMLKHGEQYVACGQEEYERQYQERLLKNLARQASRMGCQLVVENSGEVLS